MRRNWSDLSSDAQEVVTALKDLVGPKEDTTMRELCGDQGVWSPSDLEYYAGDKASIL